MIFSHTDPQQSPISIMLRSIKDFSVYFTKRFTNIVEILYWRLPNLSEKFYLGPYSSSIKPSLHKTVN
jgi:hypothetical protein